ncbi:TolC family protein [Membranihabitans marinus]|uniref:TolC family protein n=1 Tax=Membranihabitans marinus TaxID=1227546 RepID=UPI001F008BE9|nr:TolC family protein [Membranihabitans marinus]
MNIYCYPTRLIQIICMVFSIHISPTLIPAQSLDQLIQIAHGHSPENDISASRLLNAQFQHQVYRASLRPNISFDATLPNLLRSISSVTTDDGREIFINRSLLTNSLDLSLNYNIRKTGGSIFARTGLKRLDVLSTPTSRSYYATPISIGIIQPLSRYNPFTWEDKKAPLQLSIAEKKYYQEKENISQAIVNAYFDLMMAQIDAKFADDRLHQNTELLSIANQRFHRGLIGREEILQLEINVNTNQSALASARLAIELNNDKLNSVLGNQKTISYQMDIIEFQDLSIEDSLALRMFRAHHPLYEEINYSEIEAMQELVAAKAEGRKVDLIAQVGFSQTDAQLPAAYSNLDDQELFRLGISMPITDWGLSKARVQTATVNCELVLKTNAWNIIEEERNLLSTIKQFHLLKQQLNLLQLSLDLAQEHVGLSRERYLKGSATINDYNLALNNETQQRNLYYQSLRDYWTTYYQIRGQCLYDFKNQSVIQY